MKFKSHAFLLSPQVLIIEYSFFNGTSALQNVCLLIHEIKTSAVSDHLKSYYKWTPLKGSPPIF